MTAAAFAKWSVVTLIALAVLTNIAVNMRKSSEGSVIAGVIIGILLRVWMVVAICLWWQT